MKIWGILRSDGKIQKDVVQELDFKTRYDIQSWLIPISNLCRELDLAVPILLNKHIQDIVNFSRVTFRQEDFMEPIAFEKFEVELFNEKKK